MAITYSYQQYLYMTADGYVKYNISPAPGTTMFPGDVFTVSGELYMADYAPASITVEFRNEMLTYQTLVRPTAVCEESIVVNGKAGKAVAFAGKFTVPDASELKIINTNADTISFPAYIAFLILDVDNEVYHTCGLEDATYTTVKRGRLAPSVSNVTFTDDNGHLPKFGGFIQGRSLLHISFDESTDPLDANLTIAKRVLELGTYANDVFTVLHKYELESNNAVLGLVDHVGTLSYRLTVTDSMDQSNISTLYLFSNGAVSGYNWSTNVFARPEYTGSASGSINTNDMNIKIPTVTGGTSISFNAHVCTGTVVEIPKNATMLKVRARKSSVTTTYLNFGMLPTNAPNSYSVANGGQLSGDKVLTTDMTEYTMYLSDAVKTATNLKCIVNARAYMKKGVYAANAVIEQVWFE